MMHDHVRSRLSAYLEGELGAREEASLEAHLAECAPCTAELRALRRAIDLLHSLAVPEPPSDIGGAVLERLRAGEGAPRGMTARFARTFRAPLVRIAPFALAAGIGAVGYWMTINEPAPQMAARETRPPAAPAEAVEYRSGPIPPILQGGQAQRVAVSPLPVCLERFRTGRPAGPDCVAWDAYLASLASDDASRFALEIARLPKSHQRAVMERFTRFAAVTGSAPILGSTFRHSRDPQMVRFAPRVERTQSAPLRLVGWDGR
jgi:hypothetical protein